MSAAHRWLLLLSAWFAVGAEPAPRTDRYGDPLPPGALARLGTLRLRHAGEVTSLAFSPDGKVLASTGHDRTLRLWDPATGRELRRVEDESFRVSRVVFAPDGKTLVTASSISDQVRLWDAATGKAVRQHAVQGRVRAVAFSPDGKNLAAVTGPGTLVIWNSATGAEVRRLENKEKEKKDITALAYAPDGRNLALGYGDQTLSILYLGADKPPLQMEGRWLGHGQVLFAPDGKTVVSRGDLYNVWLWDPATGKVRRKIEELVDTFPLAFAPDGRLLVSDGPRGTLRLWDLEQGKGLSQFRGYHIDHCAIAISPDGKTLATGGEDQIIRLWDMATGKERKLATGPEGQVQAVVYSPDGRTVVSAALDSQILIWDQSTGRLLRTLAEQPDCYYPLAFTPDSQLLASGSWFGMVRLWDPSSGKLVRRIGVAEDSDFLCAPVCVAFSPDGKLLATGASSGKIHLWETATGKKVRQWKGQERSITSVIFSRDGRMLATTGYNGLAATGRNGLVSLWKVDTGALLRQYDHGDTELNCVTFSPDGRFLASAGQDRIARLWRVESGREVGRLAGHRGDVTSLVYAPDGRSLAGGTTAGTIHLWEMVTGQVRTEFQGHQGAILAVAYAPNGKTLVSASRDTTALIWDVSGQASETPPTDLTPHDLDRLWTDLGSLNAERAHRALWTLVRVPTQAIPLLRERIRVERQPQGIRQLIDDLDSEDFPVRQKAMEALRQLGKAAEPALFRKLREQPTLEVRRRILDLLNGTLEPDKVWPTPDRLRNIRGVELLEYIGTAEARQLLKKWAESDPDTLLAQDAAGSLERLQRRSKPAPGSP